MLRKIKKWSIILMSAVVLMLMSHEAHATGPDEALLQQKEFCMVLLYGNTAPSELSAAGEASIVSCMLAQPQP